MPARISALHTTSADDVVFALDTGDHVVQSRLACGQPMVWVPQLGGTGRLAVLRYEIAHLALSSSLFGCAGMAKQFVASAPPEIRPALAPVERWLLYLDPPDHTNLRRAMARSAEFESVLSVTEIVERRVGQFLQMLLDSGGRADWVDDVARKVPLEVISRSMGLPSKDAEFLTVHSDALIRVIEPGPSPQEVNDAASSWLELWGYFNEGFQDAGTFSARLLRESGGTLDEPTVIANCISLLLGGHETTRSLLSSVIRHVAERPDDVPSLAADDGYVAAFVEEVLRLSGPSKLTSRFVLEPMELAGQHVEAGTQLAILLGVINRDPAVADRPDQFIVRQPAPRNASFGLASHFCLGAGLARAQARVVARTLAAFLMQKGVRLTIEECRMHSSQVLYNYQRLMVSLSGTRS